jgi:hypothetical protein
MNMRHLIAIATLIAAGQPVQAEDDAPACKTSDDVSARCILAHPESPFVQGYVAGLKRPPERQREPPGGPEFESGIRVRDRLR